MPGLWHEVSSTLEQLVHEGEITPKEAAEVYSSSVEEFSSSLPEIESQQTEYVSSLLSDADGHANSNFVQMINDNWQDRGTWGQNTPKKQQEEEEEEDETD